MSNTIAKTWLFRWGLALPLLLSVFLFSQANSAQAAPPANDNFANAITLSAAVPQTVTGTNVEATKQTGEPNHAGDTGGKSVWWTWTASASASATINTFGSNFDTVLVVYTGSSVSSLTSVAFNDDTQGGQSQVQFQASAGTTYRIAVDGFNAASGSITLNITQQLPTNDNFANAILVPGALPQALTGSNTLATKQTGEPNHAGDTGGKSVWWTWTASASGPVVMDTIGSSFDTVLAVYTGSSVSALTVVASNDDAVGAQSRVEFQATAGTNYRIAVDGFSGAVGSIALNLRTPVVGPGNDNFTNAIALSATLPQTVTGSNVAGAKETGEPNHAGNTGGKSVWWTWTPSVSGSASIDTFGSGFDTVLAVYTGSSVGSLSTVVSNDNIDGAQSRVAFQAVAGTIYRIAVDGSFGSSGAITLNLFQISNDDFANATVLPATLPQTVSWSNVGATKQSGEPDHAGNPGGILGGSVWWTWTPSVSGPVRMDTFGSNFNTLVAVYTGNSVSALTVVASNDAAGSSQSRVGFQAIAGTTYRIAVDGNFGKIGSIALNLSVGNPPPNDNFANAIVLPAELPLKITGSNVEATAQIGELNHAGVIGGASVWWTWTPTVSRLVTIDTVGTSFNPQLAVYTGSSVSGLSVVAANDDIPGNIHARVQFQAVAGTTYRIAVDGSFAATGSIQLNSPPGNDNFADAIAIPASLPRTVTGSNVTATKETGEPAHARSISRGPSVWWTWTPTVSGPVIMNTVGSNFDTLLAVYAGSSVGSLTAVASNDNSGGPQSRVEFQAIAGTTYRIAVDGASLDEFGTADVGLITLNLSAAITTPGNDNFANAITIPAALPQTVTGSNVLGTSEIGEPNHTPVLGATGGPSVWWTWTASVSGSVAMDTFGSKVDTLLAVYTGIAVSGLTVVASNDDSGGRQSRVVFQATAGTTYRIAVDGLLGETGSITLNLSQNTTTPANNNFANAIAIPAALPQAVTGSNVNATEETGEPNHAGNNGGASVWWTWTPTVSGPVRLDTIGSNFDTLLGVYTGSLVSDLTVVASNDNNGGITQSRLAFQATAGTTYRIAVDGRNGVSGAITLNLSRANPPPNDNFANAITISAALPQTVTGSNLDATKEVGEPAHDGSATGGGAVWWTWTPTVSGLVAMNTFVSDYNTLLAVYTGSSVSGLTLVASNNDSPGSEQSRVEFLATAGTTYRIAVDGSKFGILGPNGSITLNLTALPPANDNFANAIAVSDVEPTVFLGQVIFLDGFPFSIGTGSNVNATKEAGEPDHQGDSGGASVWWTWTPTTSFDVSIQTTGSNFDTVLAVYTGSSVSELSVVNSLLDPPLRDIVNFQAIAGTTYRIAVNGPLGETGLISLKLYSAIIIVPPPNDNFADAIAIPAALPQTVNGKNNWAGGEIGEPNKNVFLKPVSVWWTWTPTVSGPLTIDTLGSNYLNFVTVYTGSSVSGLTQVVSNFSYEAVGKGTPTLPVQFQATAGTTYRIQVDAIPSGVFQIQSFGSITLNLIGLPPANNNFANANVLPATVPQTVTGSNVNATKETGEPSHGVADPGGASVWWTWTPSVSGKIAVDTFGSNFDTVLAVYTGSSVNALTRVAFNNNAVLTTDKSRVVFQVTAGTTYRIAVDGWNNGLTGAITLNFTQASPPSNDEFANAIAIPATLPQTVTGVNGDATKEAGEPAHAGSSTGGASVWWTWTPVASGPVSINTFGSNFDTVLAVYTGSPVSGLTLVASNNDTGGEQSRVEFQATAGTTYRIAVDGSYFGFLGPRGSNTLNLALAAPAPYVPTADWPKPFNGVTPAADLAINVNTIAELILETLSITSCVIIQSNGVQGSLEGVERFDIGFKILDLDQGIIQVVRTRPFNESNALTATGVLPDCSGIFEATTNQYTDFIQLGAQTFTVMFEVIDEPQLKLILRSAVETPTR